MKMEIFREIESNSRKLHKRYHDNPIFPLNVVHMKKMDSSIKLKSKTV